MKDVFERSEVDEVLRDTFYRARGRRAPGERGGGDPAPEEEERPRARPRRRAKKPKPDHYEVICISLYKEDLARLDRRVAELKKAGHRKMSRSALIRFALDTMDVSKLPRSY